MVINVPRAFFSLASMEPAGNKRTKREGGLLLFLLKSGMPCIRHAVRLHVQSKQIEARFVLDNFRLIAERRSIYRRTQEYRRYGTPEMVMAISSLPSTP